MCESGGEIMIKITGKVKTLKEIINSGEVLKTFEHGIRFKNDSCWNFKMNGFIGKIIELEKSELPNCDFQVKEYIWYFKKEWLEDIKEDIDFSKIEKDTPVMVWDNEDNPPEKRYFAEYKDGKKYCYNDGRTSWTIYNVDGVTEWNYLRLPTEEELKGAK